MLTSGGLHRLSVEADGAVYGDGAGAGEQDDEEPGDQGQVELVAGAGLVGGGYEADAQLDEQDRDRQVDRQQQGREAREEAEDQEYPPTSSTNVTT